MLSPITYLTFLSSARNVARRLRDLGIGAASKTERSTPQSVLNQLIVDQLDRDPSGRSGPATIKQEIARKTGVHIRRCVALLVCLFMYQLTLSRRTVKERMDALHPDGARQREPTTRQIIRTALTALGPHYEWSADGHDKLVKYGFAIWGVRDKWSRYWLGLWVVPNNRKANVVAYLWLSVVLKHGGEGISSNCI